MKKSDISYDNNRKNIRVFPDDKHPLRIDINGENFVDIFYANNISMGGLGIIVPHKFKGCKIEMDVSLILKIPTPINSYISFSSAIVHINDQIFGISFSQLLKKDKAKLKSYIGFQLREQSLIKRWLFKMGLV